MIVEYSIMANCNFMCELTDQLPRVNIRTLLKSHIKFSPLEC